MRRDVEIEIDANSLEEVILERNEPHFNGHLQILQAAKLLKQVGNFLVNLLCLADDQTEVRLETVDRARAAHVGPALGGDGRGDEIDERVEIGLCSAL